jgi:hypothetical protein
MRIEGRPRALVLAVVIALVLGLLFGWFGRIWVERSPASRVRDVAQQIRERVREATH